jgi:hypothetical protein
MSIRVSKPGIALGAAVMGLVLGLAVQNVEAREGARGQAQRPAATAKQRPHAPRGDYTRHTERQRTENGHTSRTTRTDDAGRTASRDATVVRDREAGTRTRDVVYTGPEGRTATVRDVTQRTDDGYTRNTTATGPKGNTATRDVTVSCDKAAGKCTKDVVVDRKEDGTGGG